MSEVQQPRRGRRPVAARRNPAAGAGGTPRSDLLTRSLREEAKRLGLLEGEKSGHVSFRAPQALLEAAKRETGITSTSELGMLALMIWLNLIRSQQFSSARAGDWAQTTFLTTDLGRVLRRRKPEKRTEQLAIRAPDDLVEAGSAPQGPQAVVLDTTVYIHEAAGTLSPTAESLMDRALLFHCSVCLAELAVGIANGDPRHPRWPETRSHYEEVMKAIPETRLLVPDDEVWLDAGVIAGTLARTQNLQKHQRKEILNDALIYLTAARRGLPVLTANRDEFDLVQQLVPEGAFYFYDSLR